MNCKEYSDLSIIEQRHLIGSAIHLLQNDLESFIIISSMVRTAESEGLFEGVKILPPSEVSISEQIAEIIERQYNGYRGTKLKPLGKLHELIRARNGDEEFLKYLQKCEKEHPKPTYPNLHNETFNELIN